MVSPIRARSAKICDNSKKCGLCWHWRQHHPSLPGDTSIFVFFFTQNKPCFGLNLVQYLFQAEGKPDPEILWFKHDAPVTQSGSVKVISNAVYWSRLCNWSCSCFCSYCCFWPYYCSCRLWMMAQNYGSTGFGTVTFPTTPVSPEMGREGFTTLSRWL